MDFIAGVDGGGTKTKVVCASPEGKVLDTAVFGPFNMNSIGAERFSALLRELCAYLNGVGHCRALCIGSAGISNREMTRIVETEMTRGGIENWKLVGDQVIALNGALSGEAGIALIAGTGSICFGKNGAGDYARSGGWGHLIGDEGSGYALGRDALAAVARAWDGWGEKTLLSRLLAEEMELDDQKKIISYTYGGDKSRSEEPDRGIGAPGGAGSRAGRRGRSGNHPGQCRQDDRLSRRGGATAGHQSRKGCHAGRTAGA